MLRGKIVNWTTQSKAVQPRFRERVQLRRFAGPANFGLKTPLRIAHLTDQHVGRVTPMAVQREAIEKVLAEKPDMVALTGDFVCHSLDYLDQLAELVGSIDVPTYAVLGNHDYWAGADEVVRTLERSGVAVLRNQNTVIHLRGEALQLVGVDDGYTGHADKDKATKGLDPSIPTLGLSHIAEEADGLWRRNVPFVLSGHTHGGQVTLARLHEISMGKLFGHKYIHGLYGTRQERGPGQDGRTARGAVYVSAGVGAAVMPIRVGDRGSREVVVFELGTEPGAFPEHHNEQPAMPGRKPSDATRKRRAEQVIQKRKRREKRAAGGRDPSESP